ncbi:N-6 DNA methylase [Blastococcus sp. TF02A-26]|uniref:Eco57I restriction-modification methylase domain-containing protein n=1 Tax=Blastococcus sp. TF02A-26 TaxID=2250577 RepID=UPI000DEB9A2A|nr:N-6 DNA methylase [Blastococcus sp. TF02A-26]RBY88560.1 DNA methyltransferase [Blastococcus sp. TF02A-26]
MTLMEPAADRKRHGKHYTPLDLADFLATRTLSRLGASDRLTILDPACGDGELLLAAHRAAVALELDAELELVGYDLDPIAVTIARERAAAAGVPVQIEQADFLTASRNLGAHAVDAVITNPPYVRTQQLGQEFAQKLASEFGLQGRVDLTHPFVAIMPKILRPGGILGLLCSNRFMTTKAGVNVRRILQTDLTPVEVFDLGDTRLFDAAVLPAIVIAANERDTGGLDCPFSSAYEKSEAVPHAGLSLFSALVAETDSTVSHDGRAIAVKVGRLAHSSTPTDPWRLAHASGDTWLSSIESATWKTFGDIAKIRVGIKTTADAVFIGKNWESRSPQPEAELLLPLITHDDVAAWRVGEMKSMKVLYPYDLRKPKRTLVDMREYPGAMSYLESHAERLKGRKYVIEGGRQWYEIWVPQRPADWAAPKIVFPDISVAAQFALDESGAIVNGDCYWISVTDIGSQELALLMLAVANSSLGQRYYDEVCGNKLYAGRRRWMTQYVARLPLPFPDSDATRDLVAAARELVRCADPEPGLLRTVDTLVEAAFAAGEGSAPPPSEGTLF